MVLFLVMFACVPQIMDLVDWFKMTRLPSWEIVSSGAVVFLIGLSLFATHAEVILGTILNHMPRYQLVVSWEDLLCVEEAKRVPAILGDELVVDGKCSAGQDGVRCGRTSWGA